MRRNDVRDLRPYDRHSGSQLLGTLWQLQRRTDTLRCTVSTHSLGWELRASIDGHVRRSQVCRDTDNVFNLSKDWEAEAKAKGWSDPGDS